MRILIATNHSYMFYRFRKELVEALMQEHEAILSTPFVGHEDDLQAMGLRCIDTEIDRRSINPLKDMKLLKTYRKMLDEIQPDLVITYSIKPNIYMGSACKARRALCAELSGSQYDALMKYQRASGINPVTIGRKWKQRALPSLQSVFGFDE